MGSDQSSEAGAQEEQAAAPGVEMPVICTGLAENAYAG